MGTKFNMGDNSPRGATPPREIQGPLQKVREAVSLEESPGRTEESDSGESSDNTQRSTNVPAKLSPCKGGTRASEWLEVIINKLPQSVEEEIFRQNDLQTPTMAI